MAEVVVALKGGLGNQIFEYAAGMSLSRRLGVLLCLDVSAYEDPRERHFALAPFELPEPVVKRDLHRWGRGSLVDRIYRRLARQLGLQRCGLPVFSERSYGYDQRFELVRNAVLLDGYFQSPRYFHDIADEVRARFADPRALSVASQQMLDLIRSTDAICVHVRRGDYVTNPAANRVHGLCEMSYYTEGLAIAGEGLLAPHCFIFSNDADWVRENMHLQYPVTVVDINGEDAAHEDLWLMSACRSFVIANSSLSWWGAWLGRHPAKRVVAPLQWFKGLEMDTSSLIPADWIRI
ncbi:MAG: hypothetical protein JWL63_486 [Rhodocyclales bacterium]|nr:hypothetical protein [Rhodocyclales bacterium]